MAKIELEVELADESILSKMLEVESKMKEFNIKWDAFKSCFTGRNSYIHGVKTSVKETPEE